MKKCGEQTSAVSLSRFGKTKDPGLKTQQIKGPAGLNRGWGKGDQGKEESRGGGSWFQRDTLDICHPLATSTPPSHLIPAAESHVENINNIQRNVDPEHFR